MMFQEGRLNLGENYERYINTLLWEEYYITNKEKEENVKQNNNENIMRFYLNTRDGRICTSLVKE